MISFREASDRFTFKGFFFLIDSVFSLFERLKFLTDSIKGVQYVRFLDNFDDYFLFDNSKDN